MQSLYNLDMPGKGQTWSSAATGHLATVDGVFCTTTKNFNRDLLKTPSEAGIIFNRLG
jgi:hypothetical protein